MTSSTNATWADETGMVRAEAVQAAVDIVAAYGCQMVVPNDLVVDVLMACGDPAIADFVRPELRCFVASNLSAIPGLSALDRERLFAQLGINQALPPSGFPTSVTDDDDVL